MKGLLVSAHRRGSIVDLWVRTEDNNKQHISILDFQPYFYVEDTMRTSTGIVFPTSEYRGIYGERLKKVCTDDPSHVRVERVKYPKTWEADVIYTRRFLIDKDIYKGVEFPEGWISLTKNDIEPCDVDIEPLIMFLDIEVLQREGFPIPEKANEPVISFSFRTNKSDKYFTYILLPTSSKISSSIQKRNGNIVVYVETEEDLLCAFSDVIEKIDPDIITGWNIINFDFTYLRNRFKKLHLNWIDERRFELFDMLEAYKKIFSQPSYTLKRIAEIEEIEKYESIETFKNSIGYYEMDIEKFVEYNRRDVEYVYEIDKKHSLIKYFLELKYLTGLESIENTLISSVLIDTMLLRIARERGVALPTKSEDTKKKQYEGAYVMVEKAGLYENIAVFDFSSYYPSIILNFSLSPENIDRNGNIDRSKDGIVSELVRRLMIEKKRITAEMKKAQPGSQEHKSLYLKRQAVKGIVNATYGVLAFSKFRLYRPEIAAQITEIAREGIKYLITFAKEKRYKVLLADTDSIFVQIPFEKAENFCDELNRNINSYFEEQYGAHTDLKLEFEKYLKYLLLTGVKKRYAMRVVYNGSDCDYIDAKGFENVRTDQSSFTRELLNELFKLIFYGADKKKIQEFVSKKLEEFSKVPLSEIGISRGISKPFEKYKANTPHIRGAIYSNTYLGTNFHPGDKVQFLWVRGIKGLPPTDVICFNEDTNLAEYEIFVDYERMKQTTVISKVEPILNVIGVDFKDNNFKQTKL